ncbi:tRNA pseudouridine(55) synthase TruB [Shewanella sp. 4t3-1-2LB]|uniref:tRNA pseudouridine(55) synthase TruB n=1 Tax=Shewanella sp. 4t3-1-2LB TaxID=2817682 RepID=UPI001A99E396|nr:tRNA pseudouridine(55) synthase TruB [Shewanella sp. 4t3-1-2LB]MBO1271528.1 tRNA pseudouridine(55) synthase TruB [Shewanella sp. 4t3-1-2LB]
MAKRPKGRFVDGVVLLDKPTGMSSNHALQKVKRIYNAVKAGHTGALDPLATGMLPVCLGEATKFSQHLLDADKRYLVTAKLGVRTDTSDADGEVVSTRPLTFSSAQLETALAHFRGDTLQVPSMFSALKYQGQPLYKYAREGKDVPREARPITVYELKFIALTDDELTLEIHCSKGTYIRTIVDDLGELLGCGAHVIMLRRLQVGHYPYERMVTLEQLQQLFDEAIAQEIAPSQLLDPLLLPADAAVADLDECNVPEALGTYLLHGNPVRVNGLKPAALVRITLGEARRFIGVGTMNDDGLLAPKRLIVMHETTVD